MSKVSISNRALALVGANKIVDLGENTLEAKSINNMYEGSLKSILSECCWGFARKRKLLNRVKTPPVWGGGNYFQLPSDCIKVFAATSEYEAEGEFLLSNAKELGVLYTFLQEDTNQYTPKFIDAFTYRLAHDVCYDLTNSSSKQQDLLDLYYGQFLPKAISENSRKGRQEYAEDGAWVNSIFGGVNG